jgi:predicted house-cleaning NTP pyrophosphatase (Maf/HAM1 superfamily)
MVWTGERLILASSSPTRRRLLAEAGLEFIVEPARIDETTLKAPLHLGWAVGIRLRACLG